MKSMLFSCWKHVSGPALTSGKSYQTGWETQEICKNVYNNAFLFKLTSFLKTFKRITHPEGDGGKTAARVSLTIFELMINVSIQIFKKIIRLYCFLLLCLLQRYLQLSNQLPAVGTWMNIICDQTHPLVVELQTERN